MTHADTLRAVVPPGGIAQMLDQNPQPTPRLQAAIARRKGHRMTSNINRAMSHAEYLRDMAKDHLIAGNDHIVDTLLAGADALDTVDRVRELLTRLRRGQQFARQRWDTTCDTWDGAASDTLHYIIYDLTNALEGEA